MYVCMCAYARVYEYMCVGYMHLCLYLCVLVIINLNCLTNTYLFLVHCFWNC